MSEVEEIKDGYGFVCKSHGVKYWQKGGCPACSDASFLTLHTLVKPFGFTGNTKALRAYFYRYSSRNFQHVLGLVKWATDIPTEDIKVVAARLYNLHMNGSFPGWAYGHTIYGLSDPFGSDVVSGWFHEMFEFPERIRGYYEGMNKASNNRWRNAIKAIDEYRENNDESQV